MALRGEKASVEIDADRLGVVYRSTVEAVFVSSPDGTIHAANPAACTMTGYTEAELLSVGRHGLLAPDDRLAMLLGERERTGQGQGRLVLRRKDGVRVPVEVTSAAFTEPGGERRTVTIARDVTADERLVTLEERLRLGRQVYEHVVRTVFALGLEAQAVADLTGDPFVEQRLRELVGHTDRLLGEVREVVTHLGDDPPPEGF